MKQEELRRIVDYYPKTGECFWKHNKKLFGYIGSGGYYRVQINKKQYTRSHVIWFYMTGEWPKAQIDHINGIRSDDRWENLREATHSNNMMNRIGWSEKLPKWVKRNGSKYSAQVWNGKTNIHLGQFETAEDAHIVASKYACEIHQEFFNNNKR